MSLDKIGLTGEPTAGDAIRAGASMVTMSGDKLLGGPQAGLLIGSKKWIDRARSNPLTRAVRVDKLTLAALEATLTLYRDPPRAMREIPVLAQLSATVDELRARAAHIGTALPIHADVSIVEARPPSAEAPSRRRAFRRSRLRFGANATSLERALRLGMPAVIARVADGALYIDMRTILPVEDDELTAALQAALA